MKAKTKELNLTHCYKVQTRVRPMNNEKQLSVSNTNVKMVQIKHQR